MNILFLTQVYSDCVSGGEGTAVWELSNALAERGLKIFVITPFVRIKSKHHSNIKVYKVPFCKGEPLSFTKEDKLKTFLFSIPLIFLKKIDIIHQANTQGPNPFARFKFGRPFVETADYPWEYNDPDLKEGLFYDRERKMSEAELPVERKSLFGRLFSKFSFYFYKIFKLNEELPRGVDLYVCRKQAILEKLKKLDYQSNFVFVPMGVDINKLNPNIKPIYPKDNKFIFLFAGRISKRKGVDMNIKAFNKIHRKYPQAELVLVGSGTDDYFRDLAGDNPRIKFVGQKFGKELAQYFAYADIFLQISLFKAIGIFKVTIEAMALAKPVILNESYETEKIKENIGFYVPPKDVDKLAEVMEYAINHQDLLEKMGKNARQYVVKDHNWKMHTEKLIKAYKKLL